VFIERQKDKILTKYFKSCLVLAGAKRKNNKIKYPLKKLSLEFFTLLKSSILICITSFPLELSMSQNSLFVWVLTRVDEVSSTYPN